MMKFLIFALILFFHSYNLCSANNILKTNNKDSKKLIKIARLSHKPAHTSQTYPLICDEGIIYMDHFGNIKKIFNDKLIWQHFNQSIKIYLSGGIASDGKRIFVTYGNNVVECLNIVTGKTLWQVYLKTIIRSYPILFRNAVILQTADNSVYALNKNNGKIFWFNKATIGKQQITMRVLSPIIFKNKVIVNRKSSIVFIDIKSGLEDWIFHDRNLNLETDNSHFYQMIRNKENIYYFDSKPSLNKYNAQDKLHFWSYKTSQDFTLGLNKKYLYTMLNNCHFSKLNMQGNSLWQKKNCYNKSQAPTSAFILNNKIHFISYKGGISAFSALNGEFLNLYNIFPSVSQRFLLRPFLFKSQVYLISY